MTSMLALSLCLGSFSGMTTRSQAQSLDPQHALDSPEVVRRTVGETTRLFALVDLPGGTRGLHIRLPRGATLDELLVLQYGARSQSVTVTKDQDGAYLVKANRELRGPHDIVARVVLPRTGRQQWSIQPLAPRHQAFSGAALSDSLRP